MLARDLIASVIKTFFEELDDVRDGGKSYAGLYTSYFQRDRAWFFQASAQDITTFFVDDPIQKLEMLTELLYHDTRILTDAEIQGIMYRKLIELYEVIDTRSQEFSLERESRVEEIKHLLEQ